MAIKKHKLLVEDIRRIRPRREGSENIHFALVPFSGLPQGLPDKPNVRSRDDLGLGVTPSHPVYKKLDQTIKGETGIPNKFHLKNGGINMAVSSVSKINDTEYELFVDDETEGITNGGHTYELITRNVDAGLAVEESVFVQIIEGMEDDVKKEVAISKNTQVNVDKISMFNTLGIFDSLKDFLAKTNHPYAPLIAYEMNSQAPIDIVDVIGKMIALDSKRYPVHFGDDRAKSKHPKGVYTGKSKSLQWYSDGLEHYENMFGILPEILELSERLQVGIAKTNTKLYGTGANNRKWIRSTPVKEFPIIGSSAPYIVDGLAKGLLSGFRVLVSPNSLTWRTKFSDVKKIANNCLADMTDLVRDLGDDHENEANPMARSTTLWSGAVKIVKSKADQYLLS